MSELATVKVLVVDDYPSVRDGLQRVLALDDGIQVIGKARDGEEAISKAMALSPDVILMDLRMPVMNGIIATREIKRRLPDTKILALIMYDGEDLMWANAVGISGYLLKDSSSVQISAAIYQVYSGLNSITPSLASKLIIKFSKLSRDSPQLLNERQIQLLRLIAKGASSKEISSTIRIGIFALKNELRNIFNTLKVNNHPQVVSKIIKRDHV